MTQWQNMEEKASTGGCRSREDRKNRVPKFVAPWCAQGGIFKWPTFKIWRKSCIVSKIKWFKINGSAVVSEFTLASFPFWPLSIFSRWSSLLSGVDGVLRRIQRKQTFLGSRWAEGEAESRKDITHGHKIKGERIWVRAEIRSKTWGLTWKH